MVHIEIVQLNSTSLQITWMKGNNMDIVDNITISYIHQGPCQCLNQCQGATVVDTTNTSPIVTNLEEHSHYMLTVTAHNPVGSSLPVIRNVTTLSDGITMIPLPCILDY